VPQRDVRSAAAIVALLALAGCAGDSEKPEQTRQAPPAAVQELLGEIEQARPGATLQSFVRAAARGDELGMWQRLSGPSHRLLGPGLAEFRRGPARGLAQELSGLGRRNRLFLSQTITQSFAVAAVRNGSRVYAAALRLERGGWRVELGSPVQIKPLRPKPGETVERRTQLAAEVTAGAPVVEAGLWLDGLAFPSRGGGPTPNALTMFGESSRLAPGPHTVVAFASTTAGATARAWAFRANVR
jgi:hypothetical protein